MTNTIPPQPPRPNEGVRGAHLIWPFDLNSQGLSCYVVEPTAYDPSGHASLFGAILAASMAPLARGGEVEDARRGLAAFDLMTFPEAFLLADDLLTTLAYLSDRGGSSIFHVGLRASLKDHLFTLAEARALVDDLRRLQSEGWENDDHIHDLQPISDWLGDQLNDVRLNLACLFLVDAHQRLRICLHPKNIPSTMETGPREGDTVLGADFLTAVTLRPKNPLYRTVCIQPLICSDLLDLRTPRGGPGPIEAMSLDAGRLGEAPPDHVDVISAVTCTPQVNLANTASPPDLWWKPAFLKAFASCWDRAGMNRHSSAIIVASNFRFGPSPDDETAGPRPDHGLTGCCVPAPPHRNRAAETKVWGYGRNPANAQDGWLSMDAPPEGFNPIGQLLTIAPELPAESPQARLLHITMPILPRSQPRNALIGLTHVFITRWDTVPTSSLANPEASDA